MIDDKELEDIFGIPQDGSNVTEDSHDSAYIDVCSSDKNISFSDEISKLNKDMEKNNVKQKEIKINNSFVHDQQKESEKAEENNIMRTKHSEDDFTESTEYLGDKVLYKTNEKRLDADGEKTGNTKFFLSKNEKEKEEWKLKCEDILFERFYSAKIESLSTWLLVGGKLNFSSINQELIESRIDLSNVNFADFTMLFKLLKQIQVLKDRLTLIEIQCNNQYFCWKRAIDLFQGILAQCHYEKPAAKQDGIVYEHMSDFISYFSMLEALHYNINSVLKNLDQAFDTVSRQITISMPSGREYESIENKVNKELNTECDLSVNKNISNQSFKSKSVDTVKTGTVDWKDFK